MSVHYSLKLLTSMILPMHFNMTIPIYLLLQRKAKQQYIIYMNMI